MFQDFILSFSLYSSGREEIENLYEFKPYPHQLPKHEQKQMVEHYLDKSGKARVKGGADLKASQAYPRQWL